MRCVVGVDPGITGGLAVIIGGRLISVYDMPVDESRVDGARVADILRDLIDSHDVTVFVEDTHPMPRNGSIASFKLGMSTGVILGVTQSLYLPLHRVRASEWKRGQGLIGKTKNASRGLAAELWPEFREQFRLVKNDGRAEAALIARYGLALLIKEGHDSD